ncbi:MAG: tetratricopeptide repeat protein [Bacteroidales bacterium]|nr:tetratricopeptide repeat protein [Bacteroidales bacterium]
MQKLIVLTTFIFIFISQVFADELSEGYKSFINNDIKQAYNHFIAASQVPDTKAEAFLMLSLMSTVDKEEAISFNYFLDFYKNSPDKDAYTIALFHHKSVLGYASLKTESQLNWLLELQKRTDLNPTLRAYVCEATGKHYEAIYNIKKSKEFLSKIGAVMEWQIVGDFENISASGFEKEYKQNQKAALNILKNFSKKNFNTDALKTLSDEYIQSGQVNEGIDLLKQLIEYHPFNDYYYKELGLYYLKAGNYDAAKQYLEECLRIAPYYGPYHGNYARVFEEKGDKDNAIKEYKLDIAYHPDDYETIKKLRSIGYKQ